MALLRPPGELVSRLQVPFGYWGREAQMLAAVSILWPRKTLIVGSSVSAQLGGLRRPTRSATQG